jgi:hypothetical protein
MITVTLRLTFHGETHDVDFYGSDGNVALYNATAFACRIGRGVKAYRAHVAAWRYDRMSEASQRTYGRRPEAPIVTDAEGVRWAVNLVSTTVRNRQASIIGWADDYRGTDAAAKYNDSTGL